MPQWASRLRRRMELRTEPGPRFGARSPPDRCRPIIDWKEPRDFYLEREPERFRRLCRDALRYRDPDIDAVLVTSFNEWPEFTSVEPADSYDTTYLEIIQEELARNDREPLPTGIYATLSLDFNTVIAEHEVNPAAGAERLLAFHLETLTLADVEGDSSRSYEIGIREEEPIFTEGVYPPHRNRDHEIASGRWLGGTTERAVIHVAPLDGQLGRLRLRGRPVPREIEATIRLDGDEMGHVSFDEGLTDYDIPIA